MVKSIINNILLATIVWIFFTISLLFIETINTWSLHCFNCSNAFFAEAISMSIEELQFYYPNYSLGAWLYLRIIFYVKILLIPIGLAAAYLARKQFFIKNQIIFKIFSIWILLVSVEIIFTYLINSKKIFGLSIQGREIGYDLKQMQQTYADSIGINKFLNKENIPQGYVINQEGFRSKINFSKNVIDSLKENAKVIMFIGDSHTEGCCAKPIDSSFVDLIGGDERYTSLNFGVGGVDPLQYKLIAEKYIPELLPDIVIIPLCLGNDFMHFDRNPMSYKALNFQTNYNWLNATLPETHPSFAPNKYFNDWEEAKQYYLENYTVCGSNILFIEKLFIIPSNLNSFIYYLPTAIEKIKNFRRSKKNYYNHIYSNFKPKQSENITYRHLKNIQQICIDNNVNFILLGVPTIKDMNSNQDSIYLLYQTTLRDIYLHYPKNFDNEDFVSFDNDHFNNIGHRKFSDFILNILAKNE